MWPDDPGGHQESRISFVSPSRSKVEARGQIEQAQGTYSSTFSSPAVSPATSPRPGPRPDGGGTGGDSVFLVTEPNKKNKGLRQAHEDARAKIGYVFVNQDPAADAMLPGGSLMANAEVTRNVNNAQGGFGVLLLDGGDPDTDSVSGQKCDPHF